MPTVRTVVHGDHEHGWIIELHDGDHFRTYSPQNCEHPMDAAQAAAAAFAEQFPAHDSPTVDWEYPVDNNGKRIPLRDDLTADAAADDELQPGDANSSTSNEGEDLNTAEPAASLNEKAPPGDGAAGSASPGPGDGAPEVSGPNSTDLGPTDDTAQTTDAPAATELIDG
jgi:hypothetical protein